jgi:hypothetical protein
MFGMCSSTTQLAHVELKYCNVFEMYSRSEPLTLILAVVIISILARCHHMSAKCGTLVEWMGEGKALSCKVANLRPMFCGC